MRKLLLSSFIILAATSSFAQVPVTAAPDHAVLLASADARLAANKRLVYDFWREVLEAGHLELADKYLDEKYVQHNPSVPTGRAGFVEFFGRFAKRKEIAPTIAAPLVAITAEGDRVVLSFVSERKDPKDPAKAYTTTWFDMFRIEGGKLVEHWDPDTRRP
jgi:predicted SnoaL-like aldol condensation-catalyzing enzyme